MKWFSKDKRKENKLRHEAFRGYYWQKQMDTVLKISIAFFIFCSVSFVFVVPFEHVKYPELGRLKYGSASVTHLLVAGFSKWLLDTRRVSDAKKPVVSEVFSFILGLLYLLWGVFGMDIAFREHSYPNILMYLILLATITAFLYYTVSDFIWLVIIIFYLIFIFFIFFSYFWNIFTWFWSY